MYLIDSNVLIEAKNRYYGFDIAPGFWNWLDRAHAQSLACSIKEVEKELVAGGDELADWAKAHPAFFRAIDQGATQHFPALSSWAASRAFTPAALAAFTGNDADYLLVAYAREHGHILVTHEVPDSNAKKRVKIPDACTAMGVTYSTTFSMLRETGAQLHLI